MCVRACARACACMRACVRARARVCVNGNVGRCDNYDKGGDDEDSDDRYDYMMT